MSEDVERANVVPSLVLEQWDAVSDHVKRAALEIAITRSPAWRDIESAPRDGTTWFLAWSKDGGTDICRLGRGLRGPYVEHYDNEGSYGHPTHWMPLPLPPEEKA